MERFDDRVLLDGAVTEQIKTAEQASNYIAERVEILNKHIANMPPPPTDSITASVATTWRNRLLILHGQAIGAIQALQAFGVISVEQYHQAKTRLLAVLSVRVADHLTKGT
jgi:hypothetical protein